jgi:hypothetical protein
MKRLVCREPDEQATPCESFTTTCAVGRPESSVPVLAAPRSADESQPPWVSPVMGRNPGGSSPRQPSSSVPWPRTT